MKKLVFAVIAAVAMVSVSNVFAGNRMVSVAGSEPVATVAPAAQQQHLLRLQQQQWIQP